jgi:D-glycero-alpha-D-manno-heptose-7-phosphate kinase
VPSVATTRLIEASAPTRVCDIGGWTDTWFAGHGRVLNLAVEPRTNVRIAIHPRGTFGDQVVLHVDDYGERYGFDRTDPPPGRHPLLETAIAEVGVPDDLSVEIRVHSGVPAGASMGTSASVCVALVAALDALTPGRLSIGEIAATAHRIEVERLGLESGVQDQLCAAHGGIAFIEMISYPEATTTRLRLDRTTRAQLERGLRVVFLGRSHVSSDVHDRVIDRLRSRGFESEELVALRALAERGRAALEEGDLQAFGRVMRDNTALQAELHPSLIGAEAHQVIDMANRAGVLGWKVNGAGGEGGSITILCSADARVRTLERQLEGLDPRFRLVPVRLSADGVRVAERAGRGGDRRPE